MRHHIAVKFIAVLLATLSLFTVAASAVCAVGLASMNLYEDSVDMLYEENMASLRRQFSVDLIHRYASLKLGSIPESYLSYYHDSPSLYTAFEQGKYCYVIRNETGTVVESTLSGDIDGAAKYEISVTDVRYRRLVRDISELTAVPEETGADSSVQEETQDIPETTGEPSVPGETTDPSTATAPGQVPAPASTGEDPKTYLDGYYDYETDSYVELRYQFAMLPPYTVELYLFPGAIAEDPMWDMLRSLWNIRYELFILLAAGLVVFAAAAVYLCCAAGRSPGSDKIRPGGLNRIPLDLYGLGLLFGLVMSYAVGMGLLGHLVNYQPHMLLPVAVIGGSCVSLAVVGFLYACVAQFKTPGGFWWRHSVIGFLLLRVVRFFRYLFRAGRSAIRLLPVIWQWLLTALIMVIAVGFSLLMMLVSHSVLTLFWFIVFAFSVIGCVAVICYGGWCFGTLIQGARYMAQGNLYHQIPTRYMYGAFRDFAIQLNSLAGAAQIAAERQLRSERMKTELITNVSHDIKTPLTSIINYVDLLKLPHSEEDSELYLEVLDRQSQRLKKLVDDLMEMSKASTGNMSVEVCPMDAVETITQVLGEFSDKLARACLTPVFRAPEEPVTMLADGRLVWRVMSNLLGNAVKYAMPNTRLYIDLASVDGRVIISLKNISREELNVRADELLERFVRGDLSRNTEGSGLGLNIAQSLMELQKGQLQLLVDGDLFKVTLIFPCA